MIVAALGLLAALQVQGPTLRAVVDRTQLEVGEEVTVEVLYTGASGDAVDLPLPDVPTGLAIVGRAEESSVSFRGGQVERRTRIELRLRAVRAGRWTVGPFEASQGALFASAPSITFEVAAGGTASTVRENPIVRRLLERAPPPLRPGTVALTLLPSKRTVVAGEQVDLVTAAWFPRDLRLRLRRPPTLQQPRLEGVWSYPQPVPVGIAASRRVRGEWYDLFITHQVVFPVAPGEVAIAPAELEYSVPVAYQFFSREERFTVRSDSAVLRVRPVPPAPDGLPAGAVADGLAMERTLAAPTTPAGEPVGVNVTLSGRGNVSLWPSPVFRWPEGLRAYDDGVREQVRLEEGRVTGSKTFRFLVVADSAGRYVLPEVRYAAWDADRDRWSVVSAPPLAVSVEGRARSGEDRALPPPRQLAGGAGLAWRAGHALPAWVVLLLFLAPPLFLLVPPVRRRLRTRPRVPAPRAGSLAEAERRLAAALESYAPDLDDQSDADLQLALELGGVDARVVDEVLAVRARMREARYGRAGVEEPGLAREAIRVAELLGRRARRPAGPATRAGAGLLLLLAVPVALPAQAPGPSAGDGAIERLVQRNPGWAAAWYALGTLRYRDGHDAEAAAAWRTAQRLAPRALDVRRALALVPPPDATSARSLWSAPVTPDELLVAAVLLWLGGWALVLTHRRGKRRRLGWASLVLGATCLVASVGLRAWYARPVALAARRLDVRVSPNGLARDVARLEPGAAVVLGPTRGEWTLVEAGGAPSGWVPSDALVRVPGYIFRWH